MERTEIWVHAQDCPHEFWKSYLMIETKITMPSDIQENNILKWERKRNVNKNNISILY